MATKRTKCYMKQMYSTEISAKEKRIDLYRAALDAHTQYAIVIFPNTAESIANSLRKISSWTAFLQAEVQPQ